MGFWAQAGAAMLGSLVLAVASAMFAAVGYAVITIREVRDNARERSADLDDRLEDLELEVEALRQEALTVEELEEAFEEVKDQVRAGVQQGIEDTIEEELEEGDYTEGETFESGEGVNDESES